MFEWTYYKALGLPTEFPKLALDPEDLQRRFYAHSREAHPDLFGYGLGAQQRANDRMALLNDAYRTLRDPVARVEYFLRESGPPQEQSNADLSKLGLLEEVFELQMTLEELRGSAAAGPEFEEFRGQCVHKLQAIDEELAKSIERFDGTPGEEKYGLLLPHIRAVVNSRRYFSNLLRDAELLLKKLRETGELNVHLSN